MSLTIAKKVPIPANSRLKKYYDTKEIIDTTQDLNFFPANATRDVTRDNYINNPFPGEETRRVYGLSFELVKQFIQDDASQNIDAEAIVNSLKDAAFILTADNNYQEFMRETLSNHMNFAGTGENLQYSIAGNPAAAGVTTAESRIVTFKSSPMYRVSDPFDIAPNQSMTLTLTFAPTTAFPSAAEWTASNQGRLFLQANLWVAEITKEEMQREKQRMQS